MAEKIGNVVYKRKNGYVSELGLFVEQYITFNDGYRLAIPPYVVSIYNPTLQSCKYLCVDDWYYTDVKIDLTTWESKTKNKSTKELCEEFGIKYYFKGNERENIDMENKSDVFDIKDITLNLNRLNEEISKFIATQNKEPYIFVNNDTIDLLGDCTPRMELEYRLKSGLMGKYNGYKLFSNNDLELGEVELR